MFHLLSDPPAPPLSSAIPQRAWALRPLGRSDVIPSFVLDSWLSAYRNSERAGVVPNHQYRAVYTDVILQLQARGMEVVVAHNPKRPDHVLGFLAHERTRDGVPVVHFAWVKDLYREYKADIFADLFSAAGVDPDSKFFVTFSTGWERKFTGARYAPEIARRKDA